MIIEILIVLYVGLFILSIRRTTADEWKEWFLSKVQRVSTSQDHGDLKYVTCD